MSEFNCGDIVLYNGKECEVYDVMTVCLAVYIEPHVIETVDKRDVVLLKKANPPKPAPMSYQDQQAAALERLERENAALRAFVAMTQQWVKDYQMGKSYVTDFAKMVKQALQGGEGE